MTDPRSTKVVDAQSIAAGGTNISEKMPEGHQTNYLTISQVGANVTDEATIAEILAGFGTIELTVEGLGTIIQWDADDLFYFNRDVIPGAYPFVSMFNQNTTFDDYIRELTLVLPLTPLHNKYGGLFDSRFGLPRGKVATLKIATGTDTASGMDARSMTVNAIGPGIGGAATHIMGSYLDAFTAVATPGNFQKVNEANADALLGAFIFATTSREDLTTSNAPGLKNLGYAIGRSSQELFFADALLGLRQNMYAWPTPHTHGYLCAVGSTNVYSTRTLAEYYFMDLGMTQGGVPFKPDMRVQVDAGVAEAMRLYPFVAHRIA